MQKIKPHISAQYRKRNRLQGYDYSESGHYFVTICRKDRIQCFGRIKSIEMVLNDYGKIVQKQWLWLAKQYPYVLLDEFMIMPNHLHGIVVIDRSRASVGTGLDLSLQTQTPMTQTPKILSLSNIIGALKTTSSKQIHEMGLADFQWQRSFYDHIIRNNKSLNKIRKYIRDNPENWDHDKDNLENLFM